MCILQATQPCTVRLILFLQACSHVYCHRHSCMTQSHICLPFTHWCCIGLMFVPIPCKNLLQLLDETLLNEKPELQEQMTSLLKKEEELKIQLTLLEESLLNELATAEGNILENKSLLDSLNETKAKSITITESLRESAKVQESLNQVGHFEFE